MFTQVKRRVINMHWFSDTKEFVLPYAFFKLDSEFMQQPASLTSLWILVQWSRKCIHVCIVQTGIFIYIIGETRSQIRLKAIAKMFRFSSPNRNRRFRFSFDKLKNKRIRLTVFFTFLAGVLGPLYMSPVTGLARLLIRMHVVLCSYGKFQPGRPGWNSRNKTKMVEHKLVSFTTSTVVRLLRLL